MELEDKLYDKVIGYSEAGNEFMDEGEYAQAAAEFDKALALLPSPKPDWEAFTWLNASLGDAYYSLGDYPAATEYLTDALNGPGGAENPFVHLRLGESLFRGSDRERAAEHLMRAYLLEGEEIFDEEPSEFLDFLRHEGLLESS